jgi:hypothetical protein
MPNFCTLAVYLHLENIHQEIYKILKFTHTHTQKKRQKHLTFCLNFHSGVCDMFLVQPVSNVLSSTYMIQAKCQMFLPFFLCVCVCKFKNFINFKDATFKQKN